jgi:heparanase 1
MAQPVLVTAATSGMEKKNKEMSRSIRRCICMTVFLCITSAVVLAMQLIAQVVSLDPAKMPAIGMVDERFQSYNIEMVEVIGGRFWKPYESSAANNSNAQEPKRQEGFTPAGINPNLYQYRAPIDLSNPRLRKLAAALGPAYVRVSGTWANSAYFQDSDNPAPANAPSGFSGVLTRKEWKGVIDFSHVVGAEIVTSVATGPGPRDAQGVWTSDQARRLFGYTKSIGGKIAATEFMNEPTFAAMGGAPKGYDAASYGRDVAAFRTFLRNTAPDTLFLGPGSVGEGPFAMPMGGVLKSEDLLHATGPLFDVFSYHLYSAASQRCASMGASSQTNAAAAVSLDWLSRPEKIGAFYADLRDRFEPGKSLWITETADAACGGNPWASTFLDTFRYLIQHASLAQRGVKVIMHNTLASSDYGLLDENTFAPRPNYWAALLWRRLMGATVLDLHTSPIPNVYVYAHCLRNHSGGVTLLVINADRQQVHEITVPSEAERYTLTAKQLQDTTVQLNGKTLELNRDGDVPQFLGQSMRAGHISFAPTSITFLEITNADNSNCH